MPYYISNSNAGCDGWAVEKEDGELIGCHSSRAEAIAQMVAVSIAEDIEPGGERAKAAADEVDEGDFVRWRASGGTAQGRIEHVMREGTLGVPGSDFALNATEEDPAALIRIWRPVRDGWEETETLVGHRFSTLTKIEPLQEPSETEEAATAPERKNDYITTNGAMRRAAAEGLRLRQEYGRGGTAVGARTARRIVEDQVDLDLAVKMRAYFARHEIDKDAPGFNRGSEGWPSAGFIAWQLWGGDPGRRWAERVVAAAENRGERATDTHEEKDTPMHVKSFPAHIKTAEGTADGGGEFTAIVSVFENVDLAGDRVKRGAFERSLKDYADSGRAIPIVWNHDWSSAESFIGKAVEARETPEGLEVRGVFFDTDRAQTVRRLLAERVVSEFSFAYDIIDQETAADGVTDLKQLHILEAGPTLKGANPATRLIEAKDAVKLENNPQPVTSSERMADHLEQAQEILQEMLSTIRTAEPAKTEEPEEVKVEEQGMAAEIALALLDLSEAD